MVSQGAKTRDKICQCKKSGSSLFILDNRKWRNFHLKDDNGKLYGVKVIIVSFLDAEGTVDVLTGSNTEVKVVETQFVHFARLKLSPRLEKI